MQKHTGVAAVVTACMVLCAAAAEPACSLQPAASLPLYPDDRGHFQVPLVLNGEEFRFEVDTGAHRHTMASNVADALNLARTKIPGRPERMVGGEPLDEYATVQNIALGSLKAPQMDMYILRDERISGADGLLASDLWSHFDVELDYASGRINLFTPCTNRGAYWVHSDQLAVISFSLNADNHIKVNGTLGNKSVDIRVDTGATETAADISRLSYFDLTPQSPGVRDMGHGIWYRYTFSRFEFGPLLLPNSEIAFVSGPRNELYIGSDVLRRYHVLISYAAKTLTLTQASENSAAANALTLFNAAYFAGEHHTFESARDFYAQALASSALPASYRGAAYFGRSQANYGLKQCASAYEDLKTAATWDPHLAEPRFTKPHPFIQALLKNCPETVTVKTGPPR
jgi:Predicted aspartyl protease